MFLGAYHSRLCAITVPYPPRSHCNLTGRPEWLLHIICVYIIIPICFFPCCRYLFFPSSISSTHLWGKAYRFRTFERRLVSFELPQHSATWAMKVKYTGSCQCALWIWYFWHILSREVFRSQPHQQTFVMWFLWVILTWTIFKSFIYIYMCKVIYICMCVHIFIHGCIYYMYCMIDPGSTVNH